MHRGRICTVVGNEQLIRGMREYFSLKRAEVKKIQEDASRERLEGIQVQWQQESPFRETLEQVTRICNERRQLGRVQRKIQG